MPSEKAYKDSHQRNTNYISRSYANTMEYGKVAESSAEHIQNNGYGNAVMQSMNYSHANVQLKEKEEENINLKQDSNSSKKNNTGMPDDLKSGIENLSSYSMDDAKVHYNSDKPAQLNAHAYAQGTDIHVAPGQERHLPHEAWHVVQQKQGRVNPTVQMKSGVYVNNDAGLEKEADIMGEKSLTMVTESPIANQKNMHTAESSNQTSGLPVQRMLQDKSIDTVYLENTIPLSNLQRFEASMTSLLGGAQTFNYNNWGAMKTLLNNNLGYRLETLESLHNQYQKRRVVYAYDNISHMRTSSGAEEKNLLLSRDMEETATPLPMIPVFSQGCVIQVLDSFNVNVPGGNTHSFNDWHNWARGQGLDYRTDSDIIRIYVEHLDYSFVSNKLTAINAVDWNSLGGDGNYLLNSYVGIPSGTAVGHMIGVVINNGAITQIHDQQNLSAPTMNNNPGNVYTRYIFRM
jgi:hypothetical protein